MKKIALFGALVLGLVAVSCDGYEEPNPTPQTNPAQSVMGTDDLTVASPAATATEVNFATYNTAEAQERIPVLDITRLENWPEQYELNAVMQYADNEAFTDAKDIELVRDGDTFYAPVAAWETAHIELFTKNPRTVETYVQFILTAVNDKSVVPLGDKPNTVFNRHALTVTPLPAERPVEESYTLVNNGADIAMAATNPANVYDPATFSAAFEVTEGNAANLTIRSASGKVYGMGETAGTLVEGGAAITQDQVGPWVITIDMEKLTYSIAIGVTELYAYTSVARLGCTLTTNDYVIYQGFAGFNANGFLLANEKSNKPSVVWGAEVVDDVAVEGKLAMGSTTRIPLPDKGLYFLSVNLSGLTYTATALTQLSLVGSFQGWDITDGVVMTPDSKFTTWTAEIEINDGDELKVFSNANWETPNLGASEDPNSFDDLREHGGNLVWNFGSGKFTVTLNLTTVPYQLTAIPVQP